MPNNKTFCILPFVHASVDMRGNIKLCCLSQESITHNINTSSVVEWFNSTDVKLVREKMLKGEVVDACYHCYETEEKQLTSLRQIQNKEYKITQTNKIDKILTHFKYNNLLAPIDIELAITNLCNLKCLMCDETQSSAILTENKQLNIAQANQKEFTWNEDAIEHVNELFRLPTTRFINLRGGEPFVVPEIKELILTAIKNDTAKNLKLQIITNCTKFNASWIDIFNQFSEVRFMCSLEGVGKLNEYIRYGSNWEIVSNNIALMKQIKNATVIVNTVVQNINVLGLPELIAWTQQQNIYLQLFILINPPYLQLENLPVNLQQLAIARLIQTRDTLIDPGLVPELISIIDHLTAIQSTYLTSNWDTFVKTIAMRDKIRKNSIIDTIPELALYINNHDQ